MSIRYLCPICDHELIAGSFCASCKKRIKEPIVYKGGYLPNEDLGNYTLNRNMTDKERRAVTRYNYQTVQDKPNTQTTAGRTYTSTNSRANTASTAGRTYTSTNSRTNTASTAGKTYTYSTRTNTTTSSTRVNTDYGNCGGHKDSDYGKPNVDPHTPKKKKKSGFGYIALIYIIIMILKIIFDGLG